MREFFVFLCGKKEEENEKSSLGRKRGTDKSEKSSKKASSLKAKAESAETSKNFFLQRHHRQRKKVALTLCRTKALIRALFIIKTYSLSLERERESALFYHTNNNNTKNKEPNHHHRALES